MPGVETVRTGPILRADGLRELKSDLRRTGLGLEKRLQQANKTLAEGVAEEARNRVYPAVYGRSSRGTVIAGRKSKKGTGLSATRDSIRAQASATESRIVAGGPKAPAFFGHEFGGGRRVRTRQFPAWRGNSDGAGYFLYPTIRRHAADIADTYGDFIDDELAKAASS